MEQNAHIKNIVDYDTNNSKIALLRHDLLYACYVLSENFDNFNKKNIIYINELEELPEDQRYLNNVNFAVGIKEEIYSYGICLLNKWAGFNKVLINTLLNKSQANYISETLFNYYKESRLYYDKLSELSRKLFYFISTTNYTPSLDIDDMINLLDEDTEILFKMLPENNVPVGYLINEALVNRCLNNNFDKNSNFYKLYKSGSRFSKNQLSRIAINLGYVSDEKNIINSNPIRTNLLKGLSTEEFFRSSYGTRKGLVSKSLDTPRSGYLERTLTMALSLAEIAEDDCGDEIGFEIEVIDEKHAESLINKFYKNDDNRWDLITSNNYKNFVNNKIFIRSPMTCKTKDFKICKKCFGNKKIPTKYVGVTAGQVLAERTTQLSMRVFHESGAATLSVDKELLTFIEKYLEEIAYDDNHIILEFNQELSQEIQDKFKEIKTFKLIDNNNVIFDKEYQEETVNDDVSGILSEFKNLLRSNSRLDENLQPSHFYQKFMEIILKIGSPYSSYVEILFANQFTVDKEQNEFWRYNQDKLATCKFGDKTLSKNLSPLLGILYEPNSTSLNMIEDVINNISKAENIYEKIYLGNFD